MKTSLIIFCFIVIGIIIYSCNRGDTNPHDKSPQEEKNPDFDAENLINNIKNSPYYKNLQPLSEFVANQVVVNSETGNSGFILFLSNNTWAAAYRDGSCVGSSFGQGVPSADINNLINSSGFGDASESIDKSVPYASQDCDIQEEVKKSHNKKITGLAYGENSFNFAFEEGRELDVMLVDDKDGKPAFRVFWEQW
ncbi:hypothetical protein ACFL2O_09385 [Thermodesulfobacteriota bacterium]